MKACVTGATGFIGSKLCLWLKEQGYAVVALGLVNNDVEQQRKNTLESEGVKVVLGNVTEKDTLQPLLEGCDTVFHLAAAQHEANVPDQYFRDINVDGTKNILEASVAAGIKHFVHGSTIGIYGDAMDGELDEDSRQLPANIYGTTKLEGEKVALSYSDKLNLVVIRISETYGPGDGRLLKLFKGIKKGTFFVIGSGKNIHQLIYVDDLIRGMHAAATSEGLSGKVFVLAGQETLSTTQMCEHVACAVESSPPWLKVPLFPFVIIATILEIVCKPLGIQPPLHRRRLDFFHKSFFFNNTKAENELKFKSSISFAEGTKLTAKWYKEQKWL